MKVETTVVEKSSIEKSSRTGKSALPGIFPEKFILTKANAPAVAAYFGRRWQSKFLSTLLLSNPQGLTREQITGALLDAGYKPERLKEGQTLVGAAFARFVQHFRGVKSQQVDAFKTCTIAEKGGKVVMTSTRVLPVLDVSHIPGKNVGVVRAKNVPAKNV